MYAFFALEVARQAWSRNVNGGIKTWNAIRAQFQAFFAEAYSYGAVTMPHLKPRRRA